MVYQLITPTAGGGQRITVQVKTVGQSNHIPEATFNKVG